MQKDYHQQLIDALKTNDRYKDLEYLSRTNSSGWEQLDYNSLIQAGGLVADYLNLSGGSVGDLDIYKLLQAYFLDKEKRAEINKILRD